MLETDLYGPLKTWFEDQGFLVRGEVLHCDLVAQKGDDLVVVELKLKPSLKLLYQATDRLQLTDEVYIALHAPTKKRKSSQWIHSLQTYRSQNHSKPTNLHQSKYKGGAGG